MNYQMIFSNQAFLLAEKYSWVFGICIPLLVVLSLAAAVLLKWTWKNQKQLMKNRISASNGHSSCFCGNFMESTFNGQGLWNHFLEMLSLKSIDWLNTKATFWVLVISYIWRNLGYDIVPWLAGPSIIPNLFMRQQRWMEQVPGNVFTRITCPNLLPLSFYHCSSVAAERL